MELSNGCICCTINEDLVEAVYKVMEQNIDYLIIETTGIADPVPIAITFLGTELRDMTRLDSILTVIDAESFTIDHFGSEAARQQLIYSDITILNKTDLVDSEQVDRVEGYIVKMKSGARVLRSQHGQVALSLILGVEMSTSAKNQELLAQKSATKHDHHDHSSHDHAHAKHDHSGHRHHSDHLENDGFSSISFVSEHPFDITKFDNFIHHVMSKSIFRAKGILWFATSEQRHIFQLSGPRFEMNAEDWRNENRKNQLVFVGRDLDGDDLTEKLNNCLAI
jgi:G3E family GTPase